MLFNSAEFIFAFLPISLLVYFSIGRIAGSAARIWLCIASLGFYAWWEPHFLVVLAVSILFNFGISILIDRARGRARSGWLAVGVVGNLSGLGYYKYAMWLTSVGADLGLIGSPITGIVLPLGISFFTFTQIGYLIDVKDDIAKERGFINYVLFVTFFPHLIAGPILHHREVMPQFADRTTSFFSSNNFAVGMTVFLVGLFKKTVIADGLQPIVAAGYAQPDQIGVAMAWLTMVAYSAQLYFDFSGYSDMAVGIAAMFNIRFPINFNSPYKAPTVAEFWQRWHMTLTRYLNAYLYNPVAVPLTRHALARNPQIRDPLGTPSGFLLIVAVPTFWTMVLAGIWHGAGAQFVVFGLLHAIFITTNRLWGTYGYPLKKPKKGQQPTPTYRARFALAVVLTLICTTTANLFFRAPDLNTALLMLQGAFGANGLGQLVVAKPFSSIAEQYAAVGAAFLVIWGMPNIYEILGKDSPGLGKISAIQSGFWQWHFTRTRAIAVAILGFLGILFMGRTTEFIYFQF